MNILWRKFRTQCRPKRASVRRLTTAILFILFMAAAVLGGSGGCNSAPAFEFDDLDLVPAQEELTEFSLGQYRIPIPLGDDRAANRPPRRNNLQLDFELFALISPHDDWQIREAWKRHEGKIRDRVIRICRNASLDELQEPELTTLKDRLMDALAPHLGDKDLRQLLITEIVSQEIGVQGEQVAQAEESRKGEVNPGH